MPSRCLPNLRREVKVSPLQQTYVTDNDFHPYTPLPSFMLPICKGGKGVARTVRSRAHEGKFLASLVREFCQRRPDMPVKSSLAIALVPTSSTCSCLFCPCRPDHSALTSHMEMDGWMDMCMRR